MSLSTITRTILVDLASRPAYNYLAYSYLGDASVRGRQIPYVATDPADASIASRAAPTDENPSTESLVVDQSAAYNVGIPMQESRQYLEGAWVQSITPQYAARMMYKVARAAASEQLRAATSGGLNAAPFDGANVVNGALAALTRTDFADAEAGLVGGGAPRSAMLYAASPRAFGRIRELFRESIREMNVGSPALGVGFANGLSLNGVPLLEDQALPDTYTVAASASSITSNVCTATVPAGHGLQVGMKVYTTGASANVASGSEVPITAATATSVSFALTASNDASNGAMNIVVPASVVTLGIIERHFWAGDIVPRVREVADAERPHGNALQFATLYGVKVLNGATRVILVP